VTHCIACACDVHPMQDLTKDGRIVDICPKCNGGLQIVKVEAATLPKPQPVRNVVREALERTSRPTRSTDIPGLLRERAESLRMEIADYEAKRSELAMLERMLLAADQHEPEVTSSASWVTPRHLNGHH
jgi:hypothetical protein